MNRFAMFRIYQSYIPKLEHFWHISKTEYLIQDVMNTCQDAS